MNQIDTINQQPEVGAACASFHERLDLILDQIVAIQQIPAPTFDEERRARYVEERFQSLGLIFR